VRFYARPHAARTDLPGRTRWFRGERPGLPDDTEFGPAHENKYVGEGTEVLRAAELKEALRAALGSGAIPDL
jgi:hypothetical protein